MSKVELSFESPRSSHWLNDGAICQNAQRLVEGQGFLNILFVGVVDAASRPAAG